MWYTKLQSLFKVFKGVFIIFRRYTVQTRQNSRTKIYAKVLYFLLAGFVVVFFSLRNRKNSQRTSSGHWKGRGISPTIFCFRHLRIMVDLNDIALPFINLTPRRLFLFMKDISFVKFCIYKRPLWYCNLNSRTLICKKITYFTLFTLIMRSVIQVFGLRLHGCPYFVLFLEPKSHQGWLYCWRSVVVFRELIHQCFGDSDPSKVLLFCKELG